MNVGRLAASVYYELTNLRYATRIFVAHRLSSRATYSYTPLARTTLIIEANTLTLRSIAQIVSSYTFGALSTISLVLSESSGQQILNLGDGANWYDHANFTAVLAFAYGFTPF